MARWDRLRWLARVTNRVEGWQLRVLGTSLVAVTRRRDVLLLETVGRRTGVTRRTPVTYRTDADGSFVIGGGAGGMTKVDWVANLRRRPVAHAWVRRRRIEFLVAELMGDERDAAHAAAAARWPEVDRYEAVSNRRIPYFRLSGAGATRRRRQPP